MKLPTKKQANLAIDIINAVSKGKTIQYKQDNKWKDCTDDYKAYTFENVMNSLLSGPEYRIKPPRKLVSWTYEEWVKKLKDPNFLIKSKTTKNMFRIIEVTEKFIYYGNQSDTFYWMLTYFTDQDGNPLGKYSDE